MTQRPLSVFAWTLMTPGAALPAGTGLRAASWPPPPAASLLQWFFHFSCFVPVMFLLEPHSLNIYFSTDLFRCATFGAKCVRHFYFHFIKHVNNSVDLLIIESFYTGSKCIPSRTQSHVCAFRWSGESLTLGARHCG